MVNGVVIWVDVIKRCDGWDTMVGKTVFDIIVLVHDVVLASAVVGCN